MIVSFACRETEKIWQGLRSRKLPSDIQEKIVEDTLLRNPHAGEILKYEFLEELDISVNSLADSLRLQYLSIQQIIQGKAPMTADVDLRLCRYFGFVGWLFSKASLCIRVDGSKKEFRRNIEPDSSNYRIALDLFDDCKLCFVSLCVNF